MFVTRLPLMILIFFFQAEDGIRDADVTGVQTCALPIYRAQGAREPPGDGQAGGAGVTRTPRRARQWRAVSSESKARFAATRYPPSSARARRARPRDAPRACALPPCVAR